MGGAMKNKGNNVLNGNLEVDDDDCVGG